MDVRRRPGRRPQWHPKNSDRPPASEARKAFACWINVSRMCAPGPHIRVVEKGKKKRRKG